MFIILLLCATAVLASGCAGTNKKAHEMAEAAVYKPIEYQNANKTGPAVAVLPGMFKTRSAAYVHKFCNNNICDFAELELSKANFTVLENANKQPLFEEIALAATMSDAEALQAFRKDSLGSARYFLRFDVIKAEPVAWEAKGGDGQVLGAILELGLTLATRGQYRSLGKSLNSAVSSIAAYDYNTTWHVALEYKVIDAETGAVVHSASVEEKHVAQDELTAALGISEKTTSMFTVDSLVQRLMQRAVADLDKTIKEMPQTAAYEDEETSGKAKGRSQRAREQKRQAMAQAYAQKVAELKRAQDEEAALQTLKAYDFAWSNLDGVALLAATDPSLHPALTTTQVKFYNSIHESNPNWREKLVFSINELSYELVDYSPERCKVKRLGHSLQGIKGKESKIDITDEFDLFKQSDGRWLIASSSQLEKFKETHAKMEAEKPAPKAPARKKKDQEE